MPASVSKNNNNNNTSDDKWSLRQLAPWNQAQREHFLLDSVRPGRNSYLTRAFVHSISIDTWIFFCTQDSEEELDEQDEIEMCKSTVCSVEAYRVNACIKAENTWAAKYKVKKFSELNERRKEDCYKYMVEKQGRLQELMHMKRYQEGRERRRLRLVDAYLERRHNKRLFGKMKSLANVPERDESAQDIRMYESVEYMDSTSIFGSMQSSETVIRKPSEPAPIKLTATMKSKTTATKRGKSMNQAIAEKAIVTVIAIDSSSESIIQPDERFNHYQSTPDLNVDESEQSEAGSVFTYDDGPDEDDEDEYTTEDETSQLDAINGIRFQKLDTPSQNVRSRPSTQQSQQFSDGQTYSQFERCSLVTSTQDM